MKKRLRYAPSPTGNLHIGGARTALINYVIAKKSKGSFILRTEDTDIERNIVDGELNQINNLEWLGIEIDEDEIKGGDFGPYRQTKRIDIYNKYINELLEKNIAYKCWCTNEEIENYKKIQKSKGISSPKYSGKCRNGSEDIPGIEPSIRIKVPVNKNFSWNDKVRGKITFPGKDIGDWVIRKSNGIPTYNFAVVIDDYLMKITDVFRGEEHISNTPKQIHLFETFGWNIPNFGHLSIIIGNDGKKLSKRDEKTLQFIHLYKERGYLPEAIFNFLILLGWSPIGEKEIFSKEEIIKNFDENRLSKAPSFFDIKKLIWTNNFYIKKLNKQELFNFLNPFVIDEKNLDEKQKTEIFTTFQPQIKEGIEIKKLIKIFTEDYCVENDLKIFGTKNINTIKTFLNLLNKNDSWNQETIKKIINNVGEELNLKGKNLMMPIRIALTGKNIGPDISGIIKIFGREKTLKRLENFVNEK